MKYFAYGSNLDAAQMAERCSDSKVICVARLQGYCLKFDRYSDGWGCGVADIVREQGSEVWGLLYEISERDRYALDRYEGHPRLYRRIEVDVFDNANQKYCALSYEVVRKDGHIAPSSEYLRILLNAAKKYAFPQHYQEFLINQEFLGT